MMKKKILICVLTFTILLLKSQNIVRCGTDEHTEFLEKNNCSYPLSRNLFDNMTKTMRSFKQDFLYKTWRLKENIQVNFTDNKGIVTCKSDTTNYSNLTHKEYLILNNKTNGYLVRTTRCNSEQDSIINKGTWYFQAMQINFSPLVWASGKWKVSQADQKNLVIFNFFSDKLIIKKYKVVEP